MWTWSPTLMEEYRLRMFEKTERRRILILRDTKKQKNGNNSINMRITITNNHELAG